MEVVELKIYLLGPGECFECHQNCVKGTTRFFTKLALCMARAMCGVTGIVHALKVTDHISSLNSEHGDIGEFEFYQATNASRMTHPVVTPDCYSMYYVLRQNQGV